MYLVVFDCDGTLVDSQHTIIHGLEVGFEAVGLPMPDRHTALSIVGLSLEPAFLHLVGEENAHLVPTMCDAYRTSKIARREGGFDHDPLYPGTREVLDALSAREDVLLGVATGKHSRGVAHMVEVHDLHGKFITVQTADKAPSKPHPGMLMQAMSETGAQPERTVMIGDTSFDMEMARNARVHAIGVSWGYHVPRELERAGARRVIDAFPQLLPALDEVLGWKKEIA
ncbi:HAD-IA family hydrolase [Pseudovibrio exalbescens]|uniref:HAD-IA family hydrolase n=1 Tax=Pseudovibrio exalbescens TaxID=197461 RepID=UPI0023664DBA|nr:HAD-IA family hydrolase [Pseudovibrio exalbescens]MDD7910649.1 HAD-IA family hydrolase [Pseudovibrio exalbescens]